MNHSGILHGFIEVSHDKLCLTMLLSLENTILLFCDFLLALVTLICLKEPLGGQGGRCRLFW